MTKDLIYIINELTERGLTKESEYLYAVFVKTAYDTATRAKALFNVADPKGNASENERFMAARNLHNILNDLNKVEFGYKELAKIILDPDKEIDSDRLMNEWGPSGWDILTREEINLLRMLLNRGEDPRPEPTPEYEEDERSSGEGPGYRRRRGHRRYQEETEEEESHRDREKDAVIRLLSRLVGTIRSVKIKRTRGISDALVIHVSEEIITFSVPVDKNTLGHKVLHVDDLISDDFINLNLKHFEKRNRHA